MHRTLVPLVALAITFGVTACGGADSPPDSATSTTAGGSTPSSAATSAEVQQFCADTREVGQQLRDAVEDAGAEVGDVTVIVQHANDLALQTAVLTDAHPDEAAVISQCANELTVGP